MTDYYSVNVSDKRILNDEDIDFFLLLFCHNILPQLSNDGEGGDSGEGSSENSPAILTISLLGTLVCSADTTEIISICIHFD